MTSPPFRYARATSVDDAIAKGICNGSAFVAGGTDLLQLWKAGVTAPAEVVDISRLPLSEIDCSNDTLTIGALARLSSVAAHRDVAMHHPLIADTILASASGQIRNMATVGGNLLQRTRCVYFRGQDVPCNKRQPGSGCGARDGVSRQAALFGTSAACVATNASDLAVVLIALDAEINIQGGAGARRVCLSELYRLPGDTPAQETTLVAGDLITGVIVRNVARFAGRMTYLKVRDRASFEFAVVSVAAALHIENGVIVEARLVAGGIAPLPWRLTQSETMLLGKVPSDAVFVAAGDLAIQGAQPLSENGFKIELLRNSVFRALQTIGGAS